MKELKKINIKRWLIFFCFLISFSVLLTSYLAQYIWKIEPCKMCKLQRISWFPVLGFLGWAFFSNGIKISLRFTQLACVLVMIFSIWHLLILGNIVSDPCAVPKNIQSLADFEKILDQSPPCSKSNWKILGIPAAGYSCLISMIFLCLFLKQTQKEKGIRRSDFFLKKSR